MTTEEIKRMVDDGRAEQLTAQLCRHWEVAAERLGGLVQELSAGMDTCVEAEIYAAMMRMQGSVTALIELNKMPTAYLFSEYLDRIGRTVSDTSIRQSVMALTERMMGEKHSKQKGSFFDIIIKALAQHAVLPAEKQEDILQKASPMQHVLSVCAQHLKPEDLMMVMSVIQNMNSASDNQEDAVRQIRKAFLQS